MPLQIESTKRISVCLVLSICLAQAQKEAPMNIVDGRLQGVRYEKAYKIGGPIKPELIVLHDTAGHLKKFNTVGWFKKPKKGNRFIPVSAHFVVERDGTITQMVPANRRANHAGRSNYCGRRGCNGFSVGIEIVNPGKLDSEGRSWFGKAASKSEIEYKETPEHGKGHWLPYTDAQIKSVKRISQALVEEYPDCNTITTHWEISPGRKIDPNPLFPLEDVRQAVLSTDVEDDEPELVEEPVLVHENKTMAKSKVAASAVVQGTGGAALTTVALLETTSKQVQSVTSSTDTIINSISNPNILIGIGLMALAGFFFYDRRKKMKDFGI